MALLNAERTTYADRNPRSHAAGLIAPPTTASR